MNDNPELTAILDRIAEGVQSRSDIEKLQRIGIHGNRNAVMLGDHNISLHGAREIRIDNRVYHGSDADAIRTAVASLAKNDGTETLRGFGGVVSTLGTVIAVVGMGLFFYGLITVMSQGAAENLAMDGPPPVLLTGFSVAAFGVGIGIVGRLITGWTRKDGR